MRLVFFGTPEVAVPSLQRLLGAGHDVALVVTREDRPAGRSLRLSVPPVKRFALDAGLELCQPRRAGGAGFVRTLAEARADLLVVVSYGRILRRAVLEVAPRGAINVHFSLLPELRGAAPVQWALARGMGVTGVSTMQMNEKLDEGPVLLQRESPIAEREHAPELERRLALLGAELLLQTLDALTTGGLRPREQEHAAATYAPLLRKVDGEIELGLTAREIEGRVRGFDPWPGVWLSRRGRRLRLVEAWALEGEPLPDPTGTIVEAGAPGLRMACGRGTSLLLRRVQPEGRRVLDVADALRGRQIAVGDRLEAASRIR